MIAEHYLNMCGVEIWNKERLSCYMANGVGPPGADLLCQGCSGLTDLIPCIEDTAPIPDGYFLPEVDPAPWYDPAYPESKNFAGLLVLETVLSSAPRRRLVENVSHGATLTRMRYQGRTLTVRGMLIGKTCCSVEYGLRWLTQALLGNFCGSCDGCTMTFLTCCPSSLSDEGECLMSCEIDPETGEEINVPYYRNSTGDLSEWQRGTDYVRQMCEAGLLEGPDITNCVSVSSCSCGCASLTEVEFTIGIGNPWMNKVEKLVAKDSPLGGCTDALCRINFDVTDSCDPSTICQEPGDCEDDPNCHEIMKPPRGRVPARDCGCLPLVTGRNCFSIPADSEWFDQALIIELTAGEKPLRNVMISVFQNPLELECCADENQSYFEDCTACGTLLINYIPPYGTLRFDSACRDTTITCNGITRPASKSLSTIEGMPFGWLHTGCQAACLMIDLDCANQSPGSTVTIYRVGQEL